MKEGIYLNVISFRLFFFSTKEIYTQIQKNKVTFAKIKAQKINYKKKKKF